MYTFENLCREDPDIALGDGAAKIVLNTKGYVGEASEELKELLRYMETLVPEGGYTQELDNAVEEVRRDEKWRREFMLLMERDRENRRMGRYADRVAHVREFRSEFQPEQLARIAFVSPELLTSILSAIDEHPDWDDEMVAEYVYM